MSRLAQAVVLFLFGGAILRASFTDLYLRYVKEGLRPFLIGAGLLLVAAAAMTLWYSLRAGEAADDYHEPEDPPAGDHHAAFGAAGDHRTALGAAGDHRAALGAAGDHHAALGGAGDEAAGLHAAVDEHGHHHEPRVGWLLILPVLGLLLVAPPALGSFAAGKAGSVAAAPTSDSDYPPLPAGDPAPVGLLDYASRALYDDGKSLAGRNLTLTGFITPAPDGRPMLARIVLTCCAADGRPIKVGMTGKLPLEAAADTWVEVTGVYTAKRTKDPVNDVDVAYVEVKSWQEVPQPKQPYS